MILCAAIHYQNGINYPEGPLNVTGLVVCGRRHHDAYAILQKIQGFDKEVEVVMGFLTSDNQFLNRKDAFQVARQFNQIHGPNRDDEVNILTSEDLYWGHDK